MQITFLGTGGALCDHRVNYHNNALVRTADGPVLLDCGSTACQSMRELEIDRGSVRAVLFTHLHADHASPEELIWERQFVGPDGPRLLRTPLIGPADLIEPLCGALLPFVDTQVDEQGRPYSGLMKVIEPISTSEIEIGGVRFRWFRVPHVGDPLIYPDSKPAYGIEIDDGDNVVLWSGDTTFAPRWIIPASKRSRVARFFHECMISPRFPGSVHTHIEELRTLPEEVQSRITLMHHTAVPEGVCLEGLAGAACRHEIFEF